MRNGILGYRVNRFDDRFNLNKSLEFSERVMRAVDQDNFRFGDDSIDSISV